jgi:hypothetical protein
MNSGPGVRLRKADVEDVKAICCVLKHATFLSERYRSGEASSRITEECKNGLFWVAEVHPLQRDRIVNRSWKPRVPQRRSVSG